MTVPCRWKRSLNRLARMRRAPRLHAREHLVHMVLGRQVRVHRRDPAIRADHIRGPARIPRHQRHRRVVGFGDLEVGIPRHRELGPALHLGELRDPIDIARRHPDQRRAYRGELRGRLGEVVRLDRAPRRERGGEEIQYHRPLLERVREVERERLPAERPLRAEIGRGRTHLERGGRRRHDRPGNREDHTAQRGKRFFHFSSPE